MTLGYLLAACFVMTCIVFTTGNALAGTVVVLVAIGILVRLAIRGNKDNDKASFVGGLSGLAWLAFALGFAIDVPSDPFPQPGKGVKHHVLAQGQIWLLRTTKPVIREFTREPTFEFRSLMDGSFRKITPQTIPSGASWSRLSVSVIALIFSWAVARFVAGDERKAMQTS